MDLFFCFVFVFVILSVPSKLVVTCRERANLLALLCVMLSRVFVTILYSVLDQLWYLIVSIPVLCIFLFMSCRFSFCQNNKTIS